MSNRFNIKWHRLLLKTGATNGGNVSNTVVVVDGEGYHKIGLCPHLTMIVRQFRPEMLKRY